MLEDEEEMKSHRQNKQTLTDFKKEDVKSLTDLRDSERLNCLQSEEVKYRSMSCSTKSFMSLNTSLRFLQTHTDTLKVIEAVLLRQVCFSLMVVE